MRKERTVAENRKARHEYLIEETIRAGVALTGCEIKSVRNGGASIGDSFCRCTEKGVEAIGIHISPYRDSGFAGKGLDPKRDRRLLVTKAEARRLRRKSQEKGYTIVPTAIVIDCNGRAKIDISLCRGKKSFDKSRDIKERDIDRDTAREISRQ